MHPSLASGRMSGCHARFAGARSAPPARQRGAALIIVLLLSVASIAVGLYASLGARTEMRLAQNDLLDKQALAVAEAGMTHAILLVGGHGVLNDELAANSGGACTANGLGNASSGVAQLGAAASWKGSCYRFRAFGAGAGDGYYVVVADNVDETSGSDNQLQDTDQRIRVTSYGVVGNAVRIVSASLFFQPGFGLFGITGVSLQGNPTTDSYTGTYDPATATSSSSVGSNGSIELVGSALIKGSAAAGGAVTTKGGASVTGSSTNGASPETIPPVTPCSPYSPNTGITPSSAYTAATGQLSGGVTLAAGAYCFAGVSLGSHDTLVVSGPVTINLTGNWSSGAGSAANTPGVPSNLKVNSSGSQFSMGGNSSASMQFYAPAADVSLGGTSDFFGSVVGNTISFSGNSTFHQLLDNSVPLVANWREIQQ